MHRRDTHPETSPLRLTGAMTMHKSLSDIGGSLTALVTPFRDGGIDWTALCRLAERQLARGTAALSYAAVSVKPPRSSFQNTPAPCARSRASPCCIGAMILLWPAAPQGCQCGPRLDAIAAHPDLDRSLPNRSKSLPRGSGPWVGQRTRGLAAVARSLRAAGKATSRTRSTTGIASSQLSANGSSEPGA